MRPVAILLGFSVLVCSAAELPRTSGWIEVRTENFTVFSAAPLKRTRKIATELERFRQVLSMSTRGFDFGADVPTLIHVFKNDTQYVPYKLADDGTPKRARGYFMARPYKNFVTMNATADPGSLGTIYHEYVHSVVRSTFAGLPTWLNEGLAEYYETFRFSEASNTAQVGQPNENHLLYLNRNGLIPFTELFETTTRSKTYNEGKRQGTFYAQSWLLVHYLAATDERRARLGRLLTLIRDGTDADEALSIALGMDHETLSRELKRYLKTGSGFYRLKFADDVEKMPSQVRELPAGEVLYRLGDLLANRASRDAAAAVEHLTAALEQDGPRAAILTSLGVIAERSDPELAAKRYTEATRVDGATAETFSRSGKLVMRNYLATKQESRPVTTPPPVLEARRLYESSLALDPDGIEALAGLGKSYLYGAEDRTAGLAALGRAYRARPDRVDILHDLIGTTAALGETEIAWNLLETRLLPEAPNPKTVASAEWWIVTTETTRVNERLAADDPAGAVEIIDHTLARLRDVGLREFLERRRQEIGDRR